MTSAIYVLKNKKNGNLYVGQTINFKERMQGHKKSNNNKTIIARAINKYGWDNFEQYVFYVPEDNLDFFEIEMIAMFNTLVPKGYNLANGGNGIGKHSEITKEKISEAFKGIPLSKEHCQKISKGNKGKKRLEKARKNISKGMTGKK